MYLWRFAIKQAFRFIKQHHQQVGNMRRTAERRLPPAYNNSKLE